MHVFICSSVNGLPPKTYYSLWTNLAWVFRPDTEYLFSFLARLGVHYVWAVFRPPTSKFASLHIATNQQLVVNLWNRTFHFKIWKKCNYLNFSSVFWPVLGFLAGINYPGIWGHRRPVTNSVIKLLFQLPLTQLTDWRKGLSFDCENHEPAKTAQLILGSAWRLTVCFLVWLAAWAIIRLDL